MQVGPNTSTLIDGWMEGGRGADTVLITATDTPWSAERLYRAVCDVATRLSDAGIARGDRILMVLDDTPAFPAAFLGAMRIGAIPVPVKSAPMVSMGPGEVFAWDPETQPLGDKTYA